MMKIYAAPSVLLYALYMDIYFPSRNKLAHWAIRLAMCQYYTEPVDWDIIYI